jgi:predicted phosphodiesterase
MSYDKKLKLVAELISKGLGRRRIAKALQTTEWEARTLMAEAVSVTKRHVKKERSTKRVTSKLNITSKKRKGSSTTQIKVLSSSRIDEQPRRLDVRKAGIRVGVVSDIHYPYEDEKAERIARAFLLDYDPDVIVLNGDIVDCYAVSSYVKDIKKKMDIQEELDYGKRKLQEWVDLFPKAEVKYLEGNHENRFSRLIKNNAPALAALRTLSIEDNLDLQNIGIEWIPEWQDLQIGNMMFVHGHAVRKNGGASARTHFDTYGCSLLIGHCHRLSVTYRRNKYGTHALVENGTLCDIDVEYDKFPDWHQGFTTLEFDGDDFAVEQHSIIDHKLIANGKIYML